MKKIAAISLLFVFLSANTELHQLLKLPVLIHHFIEHQSQQHNESLADFLVEHYNDSPSHCNDNHNDHENLPFKANDCATVHGSTVFQMQSTFSFCMPPVVAEKVSVIYNVVIYSSAVLNSIWQPPQFS